MIQEISANQEEWQDEDQSLPLTETVPDLFEFEQARWRAMFVESWRNRWHHESNARRLRGANCCSCNGGFGLLRVLAPETPSRCFGTEAILEERSPWCVALTLDEGIPLSRAVCGVAAKVPNESAKNEDKRDERCKLIERKKWTLNESCVLRLECSENHSNGEKSKKDQHGKYCNEHWPDRANTAARSDWGNGQHRDVGRKRLLI